MSMHLEFEPHSWYKGAAIQQGDKLSAGDSSGIVYKWHAYYLNGMTGYIVNFEAHSLKDLKRQITEYINYFDERDRNNRRRLGENV